MNCMPNGKASKNKLLSIAVLLRFIGMHTRTSRRARTHKGLYNCKPSSCFLLCSSVVRVIPGHDHECWRQSVLGKLARHACA